MKYKKSIFNVEIEKTSDGKKLMYNTYTGMFGIMDVKTQSVFDNIEDIDMSSIDSEVKETVNAVAMGRYIIHADKDEIGTIKLTRAKARMQDKTLSLTIAPTMDCNMACPYCFEDKNKTVMSRETQDKLVGFIRTHLEVYPTIKNLNVGWYGGEPLLQKETIYYLSEKLIELCDEKDVVYNGSLITNGALLDLETAKRLAECKVTSAWISVDGNRDIHNKRRILINGEDSYGIIMQNVEDCKDIIPITIRVNIDKENADNIEEFTEYLTHEKGWTSNPGFYIAFVDDYNETCMTEKSICVPMAQIAEMTDRHLRSMYVSNRDYVAGQFFPQSKVTFCGGECTLAYTVDPDGDVYNCLVQVGMKEHKTGHVDYPLLITPAYTKWLTTDIHEKCQKCEYLPQCMGGCTIYRFSGDGTPQCFSSFYTYKNTLKLAYEDYVAQKAQAQ